MKNGDIGWIRALVGAIVAEGVQIACVFGWVAIYSHLINPGQQLDHYQAYAQQSAPWVAVIAGFPIFYAASRWIARVRSSALALFGFFFFLDAGLTALSGVPFEQLPLGFFAASYLTKLAACYWGGSHGQRTRATALTR